MNPAGRLADETVGRVVRWLGRQWSSGRVAAEQRDADLRALVSAMGVVLTESRFFGHGGHIDARHQAPMGEALAIVESATVRLPEDLAAIIQTFAVKARPFVARDYQHYDFEGLQEAFDKAATALRAQAQA